MPLGRTVGPARLRSVELKAITKVEAAAGAELCEREVPKPGPDEVLVQVRATPVTAGVVEGDSPDPVAELNAFYGKICRWTGGESIPVEVVDITGDKRFEGCAYSESSTMSALFYALNGLYLVGGVWLAARTYSVP